MRSIILGASFAVLCGMSAAYAQTNTTSSTPSTAGSVSTPGTNSSAGLQQQVQQNLSKAGFSDIKIMPESFLVRAKDPSGNPVMMVINPDSVAAVTFNGANAGNQSGNGSSTRMAPGTKSSKR